MKWLVIAAFVAIAAIVKAPQLLAPMGQDQGLYHAVGELILRGGVPYRDAWDPKPPGAFYTHAAVLALVPDPWRPCHLDTLAGLSRTDLQPRCGTLVFELIDFVYSLAIAAAVFAVARRLGLTASGAAVAFGLTALCVNLALLDPEGSTPEKYALLPAVGVVLAGLTAVRSGQRRWLLVAGVLGGIAALYKQPDLASFAALTLWLLSLRRFRDLLWLWTPLAAVLLSVVALFAAAGAVGQVLDATLLYNVRRFGFQSDRIALKGIAAAWQIFRDGAAVLLLLGALGALGALSLARNAGYRLLLIWAVFDVLALALGGTKFTREYFVQLVPSFAILGGLAWQSLWGEYARTAIGRAWLALSLTSVVLLTSAFQANFTLRIWNEYVANGWTTTSVEHLSDMVRALPPQNTLFVWGDEAQLYVLSGRRPTTRFLNTAGLAATGDPAVIQRRTELFAALTSAPPAVLVVDRRTADDDPDGRLGLNVAFVPELRQLLAEQYRPLDGAVLRAYLGGDREDVYVRQAPTDLCAQMPTCRLS
ncbi:MAG TPA: hypothetical protein VGQ62_13545 [Chloroflexota bacterium]|nr:hypothetical protein [Chloroflexota bacterium]